MSSMVQGDAYSLDVTIKNNGSPHQYFGCQDG